MLDIRRREEADGDSKMIGSGRRVGFLGRETRDEALAVVDAGTGAVADAWLGRGRLRARKISADFRTWEKSCREKKINVSVHGEAEER